MSIACWRAQLAADTSAEYLSLSCIYPPPELAKVARARRLPRSERPPRWSDWDEALSAITNPAVVQFYRARLKENCASRLRRRMLIFEVDHRRRFIMSARAKYVYVWQRGRFNDDEDFWRSRLGTSCRLDAVANGRALRFFLSTAEEIDAFWGAYTAEMPGKTFHHEPPADEEVDEEVDGDS
jgi:hypothetical protein